MEKIQCERKFGKTTISMDINGQICIAGEWFTNWGIIYDFNIEDFKNGIKNPCTGYTVQVVGMDSQPSKTHVDYIHGRIKAGKFDHLIKPLKKEL